MGVSRRLAAGTVVSAQSGNGGVYLPADYEKTRKKVSMTYQALKHTHPCAVLWFTNSSGLFSQEWQVFTSNTCVPFHFADCSSSTWLHPFPWCAYNCCSCHSNSRRLDLLWSVPQEHFTCSVSSVTFHICYLHRLASNVLVSLNYYSLIKTFCTFQLYFLLLQQQHLKLTSALLKVGLKLAAKESILQKCDLCRGERIFPVVSAST